MNASFLSVRVPEDQDDQLKLYKNLANDFPFIMDFLPENKLMRKLIERATQIDAEKIDSVLNPFDKCRYDSQTE